LIFWVFNIMCFFGFVSVKFAINFYYSHLYSKGDVFQCLLVLYY
jgi:hypothetical protein